MSMRRITRLAQVVMGAVVTAAFLSGAGGVVSVVSGFSRTVSASQTPSAAQKPDVAPAGNIQNGKRLFASDGCYECHGREAQGSSATGPRLGPRPIAFAAFAKYLRQPTGQMPPYPIKIVSDAEVSDIYAFLQSLPPPRALGSLPELK